VRVAVAVAVAEKVQIHARLWQQETLEVEVVGV